MKRRLLAMLTLAGAASAATFAGFTIKPYGNQKLNLQTGTTVLDKGGVASDAQRGVTVDAQYIEYKDNDWMKARSAKLTTNDGGTLTADSVEYTAKTGALAATGNLHYNDRQIRDLTASSMSIDTKTRVGVAKGGVKSATPTMSASTVLVDYANNRAVMLGNYRYNYGSTRLASTKADAVLFITWNAQGRPSVTTKPTAAQLAPYQNLLK